MLVFQEDICWNSIALTHTPPALRSPPLFFSSSVSISNVSLSPIHKTLSPNTIKSRLALILVSRPRYIIKPHKPLPETSIPIKTYPAINHKSDNDRSKTRNHKPNLNQSSINKAGNSSHFFFPQQSSKHILKTLIYFLHPIPLPTLLGLTISTSHPIQNSPTIPLFASLRLCFFSLS
ncbi:hypothetical protein PGT21_004897 [Puccinia graminis f. sp. tritici]|uniref:Uncharacterized protein n=1 Tax=Puccinia graminis f. sp. tritici TaxID=56615 RepID=A0A5B0NI66_PUCGR|nr:hypothetical protein PGT21_004897 [Puccinia graminis f. sp. tritici]